MSDPRAKFVLLSVLLLAAASFAVSQSPRVRPTPRPVITRQDNSAEDDSIIEVATQIVSLPVRVMDRKGRFVAGLTKNDFRVSENGEPQDIAMFANESEAFTVVLMLDMSYSTTFKISEIQNAAIEFVRQLRPQDRVMIVAFDDDIHVLCRPTGDHAKLERVIRSTKIDTGTSLYEAVDLVMKDLRTIRGRKAIILFTDGVDTSSHGVTLEDDLAAAMEVDALIYPIRYDTYGDVLRMSERSDRSPRGAKRPQNSEDEARGTTAADYAAARKFLNGLAERTGGRIFDASTIGNLSDAYRGIANELREFYSIGYYPRKDRVPGQSAVVKIKVDRPGVVVRARDRFLTRRVK